MSRVKEYHIPVAHGAFQGETTTLLLDDGSTLEVRTEDWSKVLAAYQPPYTAELTELMRRDFPLQGETLDGIASALDRIAEALAGQEADDAA